MDTLQIPARTNPYGVNQYTAPDPRQECFLAFYLDPQSPSFSNARLSALRAGYSEHYANHILAQNQEWLAEISRRKERLINQAENHLEQILNENTLESVITPMGVLKDENGEPVKRHNIARLAMKTKTAFFLVERGAPERWGKNRKVEEKRKNLTLADLRRYAEEQERAEEEARVFVAATASAEAT